MNYTIGQVIGGMQYELQFYQADSNAAKFFGAKRKMWAFTFRVIRHANENDYKLQHFNSGMEFKVIPAIIRHIVAFIEKEKPEAFMFVSDVSEDSRIRVYRKLIERYKSQLQSMGYHSLTDKQTHMDRSADLQPFIFMRNDITQRCKFV